MIEALRFALVWALTACGLRRALCLDHSPSLQVLDRCPCRGCAPGGKP